jgi:hypothetical protein
METNQQTTLVKVYPIVEWGIGAAVLIFCILCAIIATLLRQYGAAVGLLFCSMLSIPFLLHAGILGVNDHLIVTITPLTRKQIGWDEVESMEVAQRSGIVLRGKSTLGTPKMMMIAGPMFWFAKEKTIRRIFARQIKTRNISTRDIPLWKLPLLSAGTTGVSHNAADPETYVAMPPGYVPKTLVIEPAVLRPVAEKINFQAGPVSQSVPRPAEQRSPREMELEQKLNKPAMGGNILLGTVGAFGAAIIGSLVWAAIAYITHYEFSLVSIGIGLLVGLAAKSLAGRGSFAIALISAGFSLMACMIGSLLGAIGIVSEGDFALAIKILIELLTEPLLLIEVYFKIIGPWDFLFYIIAIANAFRMTMK